MEPNGAFLPVAGVLLGKTGPDSLYGQSGRSLRLNGAVADSLMRSGLHVHCGMTSEILLFSEA